LQMEQIHQLQKRSEGNEEQTEIGDIFQVCQENSRFENNEEDDDEEEEQQNEEERGKSKKSNPY
jgi:hypothetical protein